MTRPTAQEAIARIKVMVAEVERFAMEEFGLNPLNTEVVLTRSGRRSCAGFVKGKASMNLDLVYVLDHDVNAFVEYASFNANSVIGGFTTDDWRLYLDALVAHEMSHVIQGALYAKKGSMTVCQVMGMSEAHARDRKIMSGHNILFKTVYAKMRKRFINDRVPRSAFNNPRTKVVLDTNHPLMGVDFAIAGSAYRVNGKHPTRNGELNCIKLRTGKQYRVKEEMVRRGMRGDAGLIG